MTQLDVVMAKVRAENRAALIAYIPAGFPSKSGCAKAIQALAAAGVDAIEIGFPYSDPVMDGPVIQEAADISLKAGTNAADVFEALSVASGTGVAAVVMTYWNPIERYGLTEFANDFSAAGGSGVITPDLTPEEAQDWVDATSAKDVERVFLVALSSSNERISKVANVTTGFVYAGAVMGVTGARTSISDAIEGLVARVRKHTELPVAVGLGVSTPEQAKEIAQYADGVIVGSAFVTAIEQGGPAAAKALAQALSNGLTR